MTKIQLAPRIAGLALRALKTMALPLLVYGALCAIVPSVFLRGSTAVMMVTQSITNVSIGWAMVFGMSVGLFDFSVGALVVLAGLFGVYCSQLFGFAGFLVGCMVGSLVLATLTGAIFSFLRIPSIITGFAAMLVFESVSVILAKKMMIVIEPTYLLFGRTPYCYILIVAVFIAVYLLFNYTKFGYQIKAIGGNEAVARNMGINTARLKLLTYIVGGAFLGISSILMVSNMGTINPKINMASMAQVFTPMMGVMIGMFLTSCNTIIGVFIGELTITIVSTGLVAVGMESRLQNVIVGIFLLVFMSIQINARRIGSRKRGRVAAASPTAV